MVPTIRFSHVQRLATRVRSYSKIALFQTISIESKDMSGRPSGAKLRGKMKNQFTAWHMDSG